MENTRTYGVIVCDCSHLDSLYDDLETPGGTEHIPEREVVCSERKSHSSMTLYELTEEEANNLKNDDRILYVEDCDLERSRIKKRLHYEQFSEKYDKGASANAEHINWSLLRCTEGNNRYAWGADGIPTQTGISTVTCTGKNVDVVIVDTAVDGNHPEFAVNSDGTGGSRFVRYNWFQHKNSVNQDHPENYDYDAHLASALSDHGTHCAGNIAGNTQGWARDANIYNIDIFGLGTESVPDITSYEVFEYVKLFHLNKPVNPVTGRKNPTIINNSWGLVANITRVTGATSASEGKTIEQVRWRGTTYDGPFTLSELQSFGIMDATDYGGGFGEGIVTVSAQSITTIIAMRELISAGVIVVGSAGNSKEKICKSSADVDWNNRYYGYEYSSLASKYVTRSEAYHRGNSASAAPIGGTYPSPVTFPQTSPICVGATNSAATEAKRSFSCCGPRVDIFAPGTNIQSSRHLEDNTTVPDPRNTDYFLAKQNGTSMSGPQVCGLLACVLELYPRKGSADMRRYLETYSKQNQLLDTEGGYTDENSLQGAQNLYPFHKPEKESEGVLVPRVAEWFRPSEGQVWPRNRYLY